MCSSPCSKYFQPTYLLWHSENHGARTSTRDEGSIKVNVGIAIVPTEVVAANVKDLAPVRDAAEFCFALELEVPRRKTSAAEREASAFTTNAAWRVFTWPSIIVDDIASFVPNGDCVS